VRQGRRFKFLALFEEAVEGGPVRVEQCARLGRDPRQVRKRGGGEQFGRVRLRRAEEIVEPPDFPRQLRLSQYPAAAQAAEAVKLSQAVGADELRAEVKAERGGASVKAESR
jgi:hypothetical protein